MRSQVLPRLVYTSLLYSYRRAPSSRRLEEMVMGVPFCDTFSKSYK